MTINKKTYQVCLDCGRHLPYSLVLMRSSQSPFVDRAVIWVTRLREVFQ